MRDQAAALRHRMDAMPQRVAEPAGPTAVVVGSGKGGVGKSVLATLLGAALARRGRRVLLHDAAHNQGNLHVMLGVRPAVPLESVLAGDAAPEALLVPVADGLSLLPGASGAESLYGMTAVDRARLHRRLTGLYDDFDAVIVDAGPGIESVVRATIRAARLLVIAVPEPAALSDAYALVKIVNLQLPSLPIDVVVNRVLREGEADGAFGRLALAAERFLKRELRFVGGVPEQLEIARRVREPGTLLAHATDEINAIAERIAPRAAPAGHAPAEAA